jgi:Leucine-rich repeat (LRR) protein
MRTQLLYLASQVCTLVINVYDYMLPQHFAYCTHATPASTAAISLVTGDAAVLSLCYALQLQSNLTSLDLSGNTISDDGAAAILQALAVQCNQCRVSITSKHTTAGKCGSSSSSGLTKLVTLDIGHNLITSTGGKVSDYLSI